MKTPQPQPQPPEFVAQVKRAFQAKDAPKPVEEREDGREAFDELLKKAAQPKK